MKDVELNLIFHQRYNASKPLINRVSLLLIIVLSVFMLAARVEGQYVRDVPYFNQRLNKISPSKSCQNSIAAMLLNYFGATSITPDAISKRWGISIYMKCHQHQTPNSAF